MESEDLTGFQNLLGLYGTAGMALWREIPCVSPRHTGSECTKGLTQRSETQIGHKQTLGQVGRNGAGQRNTGIPAGAALASVEAYFYSAILFADREVLFLNL